MPKKTIFENLYSTKERNKSLITLFVLVVALGFLWVFVPLTELGIRSIDTGTMRFLAQLGSSSVLSLLARKILFAVDPLATGNSEASRFFRDRYPSRAIADKYEVSQGQAKDLWFDFFNSWASPDSRYNVQWTTVFERTYSCRFVFYAQMVLLWCAILSGLFLLALWLCPLSGIITRPFAITVSNVAYFGIVTMGHLFLRFTNRVPRKGCSVSTGCWYKYEEVSSIEDSILKREVLDRAETFADARKIVDLVYQSQETRG